MDTVRPQCAHVRWVESSRYTQVLFEQHVHSFAYTTLFTNEHQAFIQSFALNTLFCSLRCRPLVARRHVQEAPRIGGAVLEMRAAPHKRLRAHELQ